MSWQGLEAELAEWRRLGRRAEFWWRDDDAGRRTPALERLLGLAQASGVPLALAVVPAQAEPELLAALPRGVSVLQHGADHVNRAGPGEKKTEFPAAEGAPAALARLSQARGLLAAHAAGRFVPVLAPPWNRFPAQWARPLAAAGYRGLSQYGARWSAAPASGLMQVNTHVDIIAWRGSGGFVGEAPALQAVIGHLSGRRSGELDAAEPTGLLTHHARHDASAWAFIERLFAVSRAAGAAWRSAGELYE